MVTALVVVLVGLALWNFYLRPDIDRASVKRMSFPLSGKPSIAVMPFQNLIGNPEQEYFCDGITEAIITALSKTPKLFVIARNSTFTYKGKAVSVQQVCKDLGVRYVLEGSIQRSGDRVRITAQLIDGKTEAHLWGEKYDRELKDIFDLQDQITRNIIIALKVKLTEGEYARIYGRGTNNIEAYLKAMKGMDHVLRWNKNDNEIARQLYQEAISIDPNYTNAYTLLAWTYRHEATYRWTKTPEKSYKTALQLAKKALSLDETNAMPHMVFSLVSSETGDYEMANIEADRALELEPNNADANFLTGVIFSHQGRHEEAIEVLEKATNLSPINPYFHRYLSDCYFHADQYEKSILAAREAIKQKQVAYMTCYVNLIASYTSLGRKQEAQAAVAELHRIDPTYSLAVWKKYMYLLSAHPKYRARIDFEEETARKGGME